MFQPLLAWCQRLVTRAVHWIEAQVLQHTKPSTITLVTGAAADIVRTRAELIAENALLRQQLVVLKRSVKRPAMTNTDRRVLVVLARLLGRWKDALLLVKPDTLLDWHRQLFKMVWRSKSAVKVPLATTTRGHD